MPKRSIDFMFDVIRHFKERNKTFITNVELTEAIISKIGATHSVRSRYMQLFQELKLIERDQDVPNKWVINYERADELML